MTMNSLVLRNLLFTIALLIYAVLICVAFNVFIKYREEPRLKNDFGEQYDKYKRKVRRWM